MVCLHAVLISVTVEYKCATVCNVRSTSHHLWYITVSTQKTCVRSGEVARQLER